MAATTGHHKLCNQELLKCILMKFKYNNCEFIFKLCGNYLITGNWHVKCIKEERIIWRKKIGELSQVKMRQDYRLMNIVRVN